MRTGFVSAGQRMGQSVCRILEGLLHALRVHDGERLDPQCWERVRLAAAAVEGLIQGVTWVRFPPVVLATTCTALARAVVEAGEEDWDEEKEEEHLARRVEGAGGWVTSPEHGGREGVTSTMSTTTWVSGRGRMEVTTVHRQARAAVVRGLAAALGHGPVPEALDITGWNLSLTARALLRIVTAEVKSNLSGGKESRRPEEAPHQDLDHAGPEAGSPYRHRASAPGSHRGTPRSSGRSSRHSSRLGLSGLTSEGQDALGAFRALASVAPRAVVPVGTLLGEAADLLVSDAVRGHARDPIRVKMAQSVLLALATAHTSLPGSLSTGNEDKRMDDNTVVLDHGPAGDRAVLTACAAPSAAMRSAALSVAAAAPMHCWRDEEAARVLILAALDMLRQAPGHATRVLLQALAHGSGVTSGSVLEVAFVATLGSAARAPSAGARGNAAHALADTLVAIQSIMSLTLLRLLWPTVIWLCRDPSDKIAPHGFRALAALLGANSQLGNTQRYTEIGTTTNCFSHPSSMRWSDDHLEEAFHVVTDGMHSGGQKTALNASHTAVHLLADARMTAIAARHPRLWSRLTTTLVGRVEAGVRDNTRGGLLATAALARAVALPLSSTSTNLSEVSRGSWRVAVARTLSRAWHAKKHVRGGEVEAALVLGTLGSLLQWSAGDAVSGAGVGVGVAVRCALYEEGLTVSALRRDADQLR